MCRAGGECLRPRCVPGVCFQCHVNDTDGPGPGTNQHPCTRTRAAVCRRMPYKHAHTGSNLPCMPRAVPRPVWRSWASELQGRGNRPPCNRNGDIRSIWMSQRGAEPGRRPSDVRVCLPQYPLPDSRRDVPAVQPPLLCPWVPWCLQRLCQQHEAA